MIKSAVDEMGKGRAAERADVLRFLRAEEQKHAKEATVSLARGDIEARDRLVAKAAILRTMIGDIERGDHLVPAEV